jgi:hypothetical protein
VLQLVLNAREVLFQGSVPERLAEGRKRPTCCGGFFDNETVTQAVEVSLEGATSQQ